MLERVAQHLDEEHSKTVNVDDVYYAAQLLSPLMATYDGLTLNLPIDLRLAAVIKMNLCPHSTHRVVEGDVDTHLIQLGLREA